MCGMFSSKKGKGSRKPSRSDRLRTARVRARRVEAVQEQAHKERQDALVEDGVRMYSAHAHEDGTPDGDGLDHDPDWDDLATAWAAHETRFMRSQRAWCEVVARLEDASDRCTTLTGDIAEPVVGDPVITENEDPTGPVLVALEGEDPATVDPLEALGVGSETSPAELEDGRAWFLEVVVARATGTITGEEELLRKREGAE
jgi:hypothetical protein